MPGIESLKMLNAQSSWRSEQKGKAYNPIRSTDVAASIAATSREAQLFAYRKFVHDHGVMDELAYTLWQRVADMAVEKGWRIQKGREYLRKMVRLAIVESVEPLRCTNCGGVGEKPRGPNQRIEKCRGCHGSGYRPITDSDRASLVGMAKASWSETWARRYHQILSMVQDHERELARAIRYHLTY